MQIRLGNSFMFFLPNGSCHLTEESPGPIEIDFNSFSPQEQNLIKIGISTGQIHRTGDFPEEKKQEIIISESKPIIKDIYERDNILAGKLQIILNQRIPNIKIEIAKINDSRVLNILLELENNGKARKSIIDLIKMKQEDVYKNVAASITEIDIKSNADGLDQLAKSFDIEEIESTVVTVPLEE